jgi:hypothetical protein
MDYIYTKKVSINGHILWKHFIDVPNWHHWQKGLESASINGDFCVDNIIHYKMENNSRIVDIRITEVAVGQKEFLFRDCIKLPLAQIVSLHKIIMINEQESIIELQLQSTGFLYFFWDFIIGKNMMKQMPGTVDRLVDYINKVEK